jgi:2'-5' RNA ligase
MPSTGGTVDTDDLNRAGKLNPLVDGRSALNPQRRRPDELKSVGKPFAGYPDFDACVVAQVRAGHSPEAARRICGALQRDTEKSVWTTAFIDRLPDSSFLWVEPGGEKDEQHKTKPRSLRHFPYKDADGKIDLPHLRNAAARIPQADIPLAEKKRLELEVQLLLERAHRETTKEYQPDGTAATGDLFPPDNGVTAGYRPSTLDDIQPEDRRTGGVAGATVEVPSPLTKAYKGSGVTVGHGVPREISKDLTLDGGEDPADHHITLAYLGKAEELGAERIAKARDVVRALAKSHRPMRAHVGGVARFSASHTSDGNDAHVALVDSPDVHEFREKCLKALDGAGLPVSREHGFTPHITMAYTDPKAPSPKHKLERKGFAITDVFFSVGGDREHFPLGDLPPPDYHVEQEPNANREYFSEKTDTTPRRREQKCNCGKGLYEDCPDCHPYEQDLKPVGAGPVYGELREQPAEQTAPPRNPNREIIPAAPISAWEPPKTGHLETNKSAARGRGGVTFQPGDSGTGVIQTHERGLTQEQVALTKSFGWQALRLTGDEIRVLEGLAGHDVERHVMKAVAGDTEPLSRALWQLFQPARWDRLAPAQQEVVAKAYPVEIHTDLRLVKNGETNFEGGEGLTPGSQFGMNLFAAGGEIPLNLDPGEAVMKSSGPHVVRGPAEWMTVGVQKAAAFPPGAPGSTASSWSRFHVRETFKWTLKSATDDEKVFVFEGPGLTGTWIAKRDAERGWVLSSEDRAVVKTVAILKADAEKRLVTGIVLQPEVVDAQGDIYSAEVIERAAHDFLARYNVDTKMGLLHKRWDKRLELVESYITPVMFSLEGKTLAKGTWMMTCRVVDDDAWAAVKRGELTGFSIGGIAKVRALTS